MIRLIVGGIGIFFFSIFFSGLAIEVSAQSFIRDLEVGDIGADVKQLQVALNGLPGLQIAATGPGSPGNETTYFGSLTKRAVITFQNRYASEILAPWNLVYGTGYVGGTTRAKLNSLVSSGVTQPAVAAPVAVGTPVITGVTPDTGSNGARVVLTGRNFSTTNNTIMVNFSQPNRYQAVRSVDGTTLEFILDTYIGEELEKRFSALSSAGLRRVQQQFPPELAVRIRIENEYGQSNSVNFRYQSFSN